MSIVGRHQIQAISMEEAVASLVGEFGKMEVYQELFYYSWPQTFPNTAGPFARPGMMVGQAFTKFQMECWTDGRYCLIFCEGKPLHFLDTDGEIFNVDKYRTTRWRYD